ncbi:MAG: hypothetical protein Q9165_007005 [Trypethelium subeluteriae]
MSSDQYFLIPIFSLIDIPSSLMNDFLTQAYDGYSVSSQHEQQYAFRVLDTEDGSALRTPSRPPIASFRTPFQYPPRPRAPKDQCHIMWLLYRFEDFPHPNFIQNAHIELDEQTIKDRHSCMLTGSWQQDKYSIRVAFEASLSAAVMVHTSKNVKEAIQTLRNEAALDGGLLIEMPSKRTRSFQPLSDELKSLQQKKSDASQPTSWQPEGSRLPIFVTADIPLEMLNNIIESHKNWEFNEGEEVVFVDTPTVSELQGRANDDPFTSVPEIPFRNVSPEEINTFVLENFPGHAIHHQRFIVLDQVTAEDGSTCLLVDNESIQPSPRPGFLRDRWPQVLLTVQNIDNRNMGFEDFASEAAGHSGVVDFD